MKRKLLPSVWYLLATTCLVLPVTALGGSICASVPAAQSNGVSFGFVTVGQTYSYQASGCIQRSLDANYADPDGNQYFLACNVFVTNVVAANSYLCPGLTAFSLVGKINGFSCVQLGKLGTFTASTSGELVLYCNDDLYNDNSSSWDVCVSGPSNGITSQVCQLVPAASSDGVLFGLVSAGQTYVYSAFGCIEGSPERNFADPDGNQYLHGCDKFVANAPAPSTCTCPGLSRLGLVGQINGSSCFQLGKHGTFTASASGPLVLYCNDDTYGDNSGAWGVCVDALSDDIDADGTPNNQDLCPNTLTGEIADGHGCSISQLAPCAGPLSGGTWKTHGAYVSAVRKVCFQFVVNSLITSAQSRAIAKQAAKSSCGK